MGTRRTIFAADRMVERLERRDTMSANLATPPVLPLGEPTFQPAIEQQSGQWTGWGASGVDFAHDHLGLTGLGQTVAIIDTGIAYDHYALGGGWGTDYRVVGGWDFAENDANPYDDQPGGFHGTHVAGIVGSSDENHMGVASGVDLVALRVFDDQGHGEFRWIEDALRWVHEHQHTFEFPITAVNLSLGADWSESGVPSWAELEDELAELKQDGIFIAVAAGNGFRDSQSVGLSYPAASSFVVPVASAGPDGRLSDFSQRDDRVIVAAGEQVTSTVPDYLYGFDGVTDDFARSSGTSMATPYVAGASMLIRQAWELSGRESIDQDMIYDHMRQTADRVYDATTRGVYTRLNLERALQAALPADDFGDAPEKADDLGVLHGYTSVEGMFTSLVDRDFFSFTAGSTGTVRIEATETRAIPARITLNGSTTFASSLDVSVVAGQTYTLEFASTEAIGRYGANITLLTPSTDLGVITADVYTVAADGEAASFSLTAGHSGFLTITASGSKEGQLELVDAGGRVVSVARFDRGVARVETTAIRGQDFHLRLSGNSEPVRLRLTNLVQQVGSQVNLFATDAHDRFVVRSGSQLTVSVNGETYRLATGPATSAQVVGASPEDELWLFGSESADVATIRGRQAHLSNQDRDLQVTGVQRFSLIGEGGVDSITVFDSADDDHFVGRREYLLFSGGDYRHLARGFEQVKVEGGLGGQDTVLLYDTSEDDQLITAPDKVALRSQHFSIEVHHFDEVATLSTAGGFDTAVFVDSPGDEQFVGFQHLSLVQGAGFRHVARGFDQVTALASQGQDVAVLYAEASGTNIHTRHGVMETLRGTSFVTSVASFDRVIVVGNTGIATVDPAGNSPGVAAQSSQNSVVYVSGDVGLRSQLVTAHDSATTSLAYATAPDATASQLPPDMVSASDAIHVAGIDTAIRQHSLATRPTAADTWAAFNESESLEAARVVFEELS